MAALAVAAFFLHARTFPSALPEQSTIKRISVMGLRL